MLASLHSRLLAWLLIPLFFMSAANVYSTYVDTQKTSEKIFDKLLTTLALSISEYALARGGDVLADDLLEWIRVTTNDNLYYKVIGPGNAFVMGYEDIPEPEGGIQVLQGHLQFYDSHYLDQAVRVIAVSTLVERQEFNGWMTTFVAQARHNRDEHIQSIVVGNILRVVLMIVITSILLLVGVSLGLRPLKQLQTSLHHRHTHDLSPITLAKLPREIKVLVAELNALLQRLAAHICLTKRFVENAAHQLRTPVTALLPQSELALRKAQHPEERRELEKIKSSAEKIARLTNQLLNLAHAESTSLSKRNFKPTDLACIVKQHSAAFQENHPYNRLTLDLQPAPVNAIDLFIGEALENLLDNAAKYGGKHTTITVRTCCTGNESIMEVIDQGDGIAFTERSKVTERFFRLNNSAPGSGLGLAIVKEIIDVHHANLDITDGPGGIGTCVRCRFPAADHT